MTDDVLRTARRDTLLILLSRAARGVLVPEEGDLLRLHVETEIRELGQAEAAIERVKNLRTIAPADAQGPTWAALDLAIRDALDQPQQPTAPPVHLAKGTNAEDCHACKGTNPPYPFLCPGPDQQPTGIRGLLEFVGIDTTGRSIAVEGRVVDPAPTEQSSTATA